MDGAIRTGRVSAIDYRRGTYEVTYFDRGQSVTKNVNALSNGEYKMPNIGQVVCVLHNGNGPSAATSVGTIWNKSNPPAEGAKGLWRKEFGSTPGTAYARYDEVSGLFRLCVGSATVTIDAKGAVYLDVPGGDIKINGVSLVSHTHSGNGGGPPET